MLQYLLATNSIDIIAGDYNYDFLNVPQNIFLDIFTNHVHMVNKPTHIWIFDISCLYQESFDGRIFTNVTVENINFSYHESRCCTNYN